MEEGTVLQWYKQEGEPVTEGKPLLEVETDKVNSDVEAPATGILRSIQVGPDQTVAVETVIAIIAAADESLAGAESPGQAEAAQQAVENRYAAEQYCFGSADRNGARKPGVARQKIWKGSSTLSTLFLLGRGKE